MAALHCRAPRHAGMALRMGTERLRNMGTAYYETWRLQWNRTIRLLGELMKVKQC